MAKGKLLIIDDEPNILTVLSDIFQLKGYEVITASDGAAALDLIENKRPDVVLLDMHMPRLNGLDILREIREIDPHIGVIIVSGDATAGRAELVLQAGACEFVIKPFDLADLEKSISANMKIRQEAITLGK